MKILKNTIPLHKLYGFLLLNTALIVFTPALISVINSMKYDEATPIELSLTLLLSSCGLILSILFIMRKKVAISLLTFLLITSIVTLIGFMVYALSHINHTRIQEITFIVNGFGFFIAEGILGLLIIHSKKLSDEFDQYN